MRKLNDILRLKHQAGLSHAKIAAALGLSKGVVGKYASLASAKGIAWPLPEGMDEATLERLLFPSPAKARRSADPDVLEIHQELKRKGVTLQLLWGEYAAVHGEQALRYSQFCVRYRDWCAAQRRSMRQHHRAGEKLFIDYCGPSVPIIDPATGEVRDAQVFVAVLGASNYTYAEATRTQSTPDWIASHQRALRFFGGAAVAAGAGQPESRGQPAPLATSPSSTPPMPTWPVTIASPCCRRAPTSRRTRPKRRSPCRWWSAGSSPGCATTASIR